VAGVKLFVERDYKYDPYDPTKLSVDLKPYIDYWEAQWLYRDDVPTDLNSVCGARYWQRGTMPSEYKIDVYADLVCPDPCSDPFQWRGDPMGPSFWIMDAQTGVETEYRDWLDAVQKDPVVARKNDPGSILIIGGGQFASNWKTAIKNGDQVVLGMTAQPIGNWHFDGREPAILIFSETIKEFVADANEKLRARDPMGGDISVDQVFRKTVAHELFHALGAQHSLFIYPTPTGDPECHTDLINVQRCDCVMVAEQETRSYTDAWTRGAIDNAALVTFFNRRKCGLCSYHLNQMEAVFPWDSLYTQARR